MAQNRFKRLDALRLKPTRLLDGPEPQDTPNDAVNISRGFHYRKGFSYTEDGRLVKTTSEIVASKRVRQHYEWTQADGTVVYLAVCNGNLYHITAWGTFVLKNTLTLGVATATNSGDTITITGGKCTNGVRAGDLFYFDDDTITDATAVTTVDTDDQLTVTSYAGGNHAGASAFTLIRTLTETADISMAVFDDRLYIADGVGPLHWLNAALDTFRPAGLIKPDARPTLAEANDANGGMVAAETHQWMIAYKDANGTVGPGAVSVPVTMGEERMDVTCNDAPPPWATRRLLFRTMDGSGTFYRTTRPIDTKLKTATYSSPSSTLTLEDAADDLRADAHIDQYVKFAGTSTEYKITDNTASVITVTGDASSATGGESGTDFITVLAEYDIDDAAISDRSADTELDENFEGPGGITNTTRSYNEPPPVGLSHLTKFRGDGRLCGLQIDTGTRIWFSGRPQFAPKTGQPELYGNGEPEFWPVYHDAGPKDGDSVQGIIELGFGVFAVKRNSVWELDHRADDVSLWGWGPVQGAERIGCVAPKTIVAYKGLAFWLGRVGEELDLVRFNGVSAKGFGRPDMGDCFDTMLAAYLTEATAAVFGGRLYLSYTHTGNTTNSRTLRYDYEVRAFDIQPWGCGVFHAKASDSLLYTGAPSDVGHIYQVLGSAKDATADIVRVLQTGDAGFQDVEHPVHFTHLVLEIIID